MSYPYGQSQPYPPPPQGGQYPPPGGYPSQGGYPPQGGFGAPGGYPPQGGYAPPPPQPGFQQPPPYGGDPYIPAGETTRFHSYHGAYGGAGYVEDPEVKGFDFSDASIRRGFIRKVYSVLMCQLSISLAVIAWFLYHEPTRLYVRQHYVAFFIVSFVGSLVCIIALSCCGELRRKSPANFIFLFIFTGFESLTLGSVSATYRAEEVMLAVGITAAVCLALTLFAFQTKWDFTMMGTGLFIALVIFSLFGLLAIFFHGKIMSLVYASIGALLFSLYLIYDTQLMLGGKHKYSISPEEYIFAALSLYLDITRIFLYILTIIGNSRD